MGFGFWVLRLGYWVSGCRFLRFRFQICSFEVRDQASQSRGQALNCWGFGYRVLILRLRVTGYGLRITGYGLQVTGKG